MAILSNPGTFEFIPDPGDRFVVLGLGPIRRQDQAIAITDNRGPQPNLCRLTVDTAGPEPEVGTNVYVSVNGRILFGGTVVSVTQVCPEKADLKWHVTILDWVWQLNRKIPFGEFVDTPADEVITTIATTYAPGFDLSRVQAGMPSISITLDGSLNFAGAMDAIMKLAQGHWYADVGSGDPDSPAPGLHAFTEPEVDEVPDELNNTTNTTLLMEPTLTVQTDITQWRTRVFVRGTGVYEQVDDLAAQADAAGILSDDGILEAPVINDPSITTSDQAIARGQAELALFKQPIKTLSYSTRDPKTKAGKEISVNLTTPPVVGTFLIQEVSIDQIHEDATGLTYPRYNVKATSVLLTLEDLLRQFGFFNKDITGNSGTATSLQSTRLIHGFGFNGTADIDLSKRTFADNSLGALS